MTIDRRARVAPDERDVIKRAAQGKPDPAADEKALLDRVRLMQQANTGGDPMAGRREGLRCRFPGGEATKTRTVIEVVDGIETQIDKPYRVIEPACDSLIVVAPEATEAEVLDAIRQRRNHEQSIHGWQPESA